MKRTTLVISLLHATRFTVVYILAYKKAKAYKALCDSEQLELAKMVRFIVHTAFLTGCAHVPMHLTVSLLGGAQHVLAGPLPSRDCGNTHPPTHTPHPHPHTRRAAPILPHTSTIFSPTGAPDGAAPHREGSYFITMPLRKLSRSAEAT